MLSARLSLVVILFICNLRGFGQSLDPRYCAHMNHALKRTGDKMARTAAGEADYDVKFYFLDIEADNLSAYINAHVTITALVVSDNISQIAVGLSNSLQVDSVYVDGLKAVFTHSDNVISVSSPDVLHKGDVFTVTVHYNGDGSSSSFFSGISNGIAFTGDHVTWTLSEPENATDWFACKQVLEDKADSAYIFVTVPDHLKVGSNGLLTNVASLHDNRARYEWKTRYPIAYYLISLAIADYDEYNTTALVEGEDMLIQNYIYKHPDVIGNFKQVLDLTDDMVEEFSELYGAYPFAKEKYGHAMAPLGGGMEHQTMSSMEVLNFTLVAHELGHQWFGDNVTCASWQDIWVNEGFARYSEYLMIERLLSREQADAWITLDYNEVLEQPVGSVRIPNALALDEYRIFDFRLTYQKGGALVHMIRNIVNNDPVFFQALKAFQEKYRDSVASADDFREVLQETSGIDFSNFFEEWYYGEGYPDFRITWNYEADTVYIKQKQVAANPKTPFYHIPLDYKITFAGSDTTVRINAGEPEQLFKIPTKKPAIALAVDPQNWVLKKMTSFTRDRSLNGEVVTALEPSQQKYSIYPNPATSHINIAPGYNGNYALEILNGVGEVVRQVEYSTGNISVLIDDLVPGLYIIRLTSANNVTVQKLVISN
jgi:aminopeptidase N